MVIVPCSMGTLGAIASGAGTNLIHRAADVTLKESRRLVIVPRETPYNAIHLENMLRLSRAGAHIIPASPGFYHRPQTIEALVDHLVFRILDHLGVPHSQSTQWQRPERTIRGISQHQRRLVPTMPALLRNVRVTLEMIKIEHTLFALPFAFLGAVLAANGLPTSETDSVDHSGDGGRAVDGDGF